MDIVSRIKKFIEVKNITVSQFADTCSIPRPTVSQLLNGRNKKVSDEVISKIHSAYPTLSIVWLMFGEGSMFTSVDVDNDEISFDSSAQPEINLFSSNEIAATSKNSIVNELKNPNTISFVDVNAYNSADKSIEHKQNHNASVNVQKIFSQLSSPSNTVSDSKDRKVVSIMVLYSDNSFENFVPLSGK